MGSSLERISELDPNLQNQAGKSQELRHDARFKQLQKDWQESRKKETEKVSEVSDVVKQAPVVQNKVEIKGRFKWDKDAKGGYDIRPKE